ncbi:hypothetical protein PYCC9005_001045 [Savitreella phatthalungensis]
MLRPAPIRAYWICLIVVSIVMIAQYIRFVTDIEVYRYIVCRELYGPNISTTGGFCDSVEVSRRVAALWGTISMIESAPAMIMVLVYGRIADRYGHKWPMLIALPAVTFSACSVWLSAMVSRTGARGAQLAPLLLYAGGITSGFGGAGPAVRLSIYSIVCSCFPEEISASQPETVDEGESTSADVTSADDHTAAGQSMKARGSRLVALTRVAACVQLSTVFGPSLGSGLLQIGLLAPSLVASSLQALSCIFVLFSLPDTHPQYRGGAHLRGDVRLLGDLKGMIGALGILRDPKLGRPLRRLAILDALTSSIPPLFGLQVQFLNLVGVSGKGMSIDRVGYVYSVQQLAQAAVLFVVVPLLVRLASRRGISSRQLDILLVRGGLVAAALSFLAWAGLPSQFAKGQVALNVTWVVAAITFRAFEAPLPPSLRNTTAAIFGNDQLGRGFAAFGVVSGVGEFLAPLIGSRVYAATLDFWPGTVFACLGAILLAAVLVSFDILPPSALSAGHAEATDENRPLLRGSAS